MLIAEVDLTAIYNERTAIVLGFVTLILLLAVFFSCRTFISLLQKLGVNNPTDNRFYRTFFDVTRITCGFGIAS